jgi:hypothetical protein
VGGHRPSAGSPWAHSRSASIEGQEGSAVRYNPARPFCRARAAASARSYTIPREGALPADIPAHIHVLAQRQPSEQSATVDALA